MKIPKMTLDSSIALIDSTVMYILHILVFLSLRLCAFSVPHCVNFTRRARFISSCLYI